MGSLVRVPFLFVLAVRAHVRYIVAVRLEIAVFKDFPSSSDLPPLLTLPRLLMILCWILLTSSDITRMIVACVTMVDDCLILVSTSCSRTDFLFLTTLSILSM